ncbi:predicted protein [Naegleria gruberi]|uniref:rRNA biogenesis protein RRP36 n=1 Tax=Naegleria gruberi TaxID=5762 RepID=D2VEY7_NAEGR|nr:uncharacterized protein NAEGRDRAFT_67440 [Naegleria gruberi]EFC44684.1 predicted protein [Naegleria gruberi]|eukprot:XP_002677428.1 predicted protein [Naegleria gruberi strain NEG-M]
MFLKRKQTAPQYDDDEVENQYDDAEQEPIDEEDELNDDELNALYEEEQQADNSEQQEQDEDEEMEDDEEEDKESSSEDEKTLSFAERLALSNMKPKSNFKTNDKHLQQQNRHRNGKHHTPTKKKVEKGEKTVIERKNKNAPKEVSSKLKPKSIPDIAKRLGYVKKKSRDPRFDPTASDTDPSSFKQFSGHYKHVFDQLKDEIDENRERLRDKSLTYEDRNEIQREISRLQTRNKKFETQKAVAEVKDSFYKREKKLISEKGKQAYFLKDSDVKKILKERKVEGIKKSGKMNKFIKKTKRKDKSRVASLMPTKRRE